MLKWLVLYGFLFSSYLKAASFQSSLTYPDGLALRYSFEKEPGSGLFSELTFNPKNSEKEDFQKTSISFGMFLEDTKNNWLFAFSLVAAKGKYEEKWDYSSPQGELVPIVASSEGAQLSLDLSLFKKWFEYSESCFLFSGAAFVLPFYWQKKQTNNLEEKPVDLIVSIWNDIGYSRLKNRVKRELDHRMGFDMPRFYLIGLSFAI